MTHRAPARRSGYALLIVIVVLMASTALAAIHQRHLSSGLRIEQARIQSERERLGHLTALGIAIDRLETGRPSPGSRYGYEHQLDGESIWYAIQYDLTGTDWSVTATADPNASSEAILPASF
ncbi:MAG: hypothetical protein AAGA03_12490 [Planctomycetota bacterium]